MSAPIGESEVVRVLRAFKESLLRQEAEQMQRMAAAWLDVELKLADSIAALSEQLARLQAQGEELPYWKLARLERFERLQEQLMAELARFNGWALAQIRDEQLRLGIMGLQHAASALETMQPGITGGSLAALNGDVATVGAWLDRLNIGAFRAMVGLAGDGSPLSVLLGASGAAVRDAVLAELQRSVALGRSPKLTAAAIRKACGMSLQRAVTIARTEQLRAYRAATLEMYRDAGVTMYERLPAYDDRTCIACLFRAGELVSSELFIDDHVQGRCTAVPVLPGVRMPVMEPSQQWFDRQDEATQLRIMGRGRFDAYRSGEAAWSDMATLRSDPVWGDTYVPTPVGQLTGRTPVAA